MKILKSMRRECGNFIVEVDLRKEKENEKVREVDSKSKPDFGWRQHKSHTSGKN